MMSMATDWISNAASYCLDELSVSCCVDNVPNGLGEVVKIDHACPLALENGVVAPAKGQRKLLVPVGGLDDYGLE